MGSERFSKTKFSNVGLTAVSATVALVLAGVVIAGVGYWLFTTYGKSVSVTSAVECDTNKVTYCNALLYGGSTKWSPACGAEPTQEQCEFIVGGPIGCTPGDTRSCTLTCKGCKYFKCDPAGTTATGTMICQADETWSSCGGTCTPTCVDDDDCAECVTSNDCVGTESDCECISGQCIDCSNHYGTDCADGGCAAIEKPVWSCVDVGGDMTCEATCEVKVECMPGICGDDVLNPGEECDTSKVGGCTSPPHGSCDAKSCDTNCKCVYTLVCDGSTCAGGLPDYQQYCAPPTFKIELYGDYAADGARSTINIEGDADDNWVACIGTGTCNDCAWSEAVTEGMDIQTEIINKYCADNKLEINFDDNSWVSTGCKSNHKVCICPLDECLTEADWICCENECRYTGGCDNSVVFNCPAVYGEWTCIPPGNFLIRLQGAYTSIGFTTVNIEQDLTDKWSLCTSGSCKKCEKQPTLVTESIDKNKYCVDGILQVNFDDHIDYFTADDCPMKHEACICPTGACASEEDFTCCSQTCKTGDCFSTATFNCAPLECIPNNFKIMLYGDYDGSTEWSKVDIEGDADKTWNLCQPSYDCRRCVQQEKLVMYIDTAKYCVDGKLEVNFDDTSSVADTCYSRHKACVCPKVDGCQTDAEWVCCENICTSGDCTSTVTFNCGLPWSCA